MEIHLAAKSYQLLKFLIENAGRVISHRELQTHLWGTDCIDRLPYLRRAVWELRCAIEVDPAKPQLVQRRLFMQSNERPCGKEEQADRTIKANHEFLQLAVVADH